MPKKTIKDAEKERAENQQSRKRGASGKKNDLNMGVALLVIIIPNVLIFWLFDPVSWFEKEEESPPPKTLEREKKAEHGIRALPDGQIYIPPYRSRETNLHILDQHGQEVLLNPGPGGILASEPLFRGDEILIAYKGGQLSIGQQAINPDQNSEEAEVVWLLGDLNGRSMEEIIPPQTSAIPFSIRVKWDLREPRLMIRHSEDEIISGNVTFSLVLIRNDHLRHLDLRELQAPTPKVVEEEVRIMAPSTESIVLPKKSVKASSLDEMVNSFSEDVDTQNDELREFLNEYEEKLEARMGEMGENLNKGPYLMMKSYLRRWKKNPLTKTVNPDSKLTEENNIFWSRFQREVISLDESRKALEGIHGQSITRRDDFLKSKEQLFELRSRVSKLGER